MLIDMENKDEEVICPYCIDGWVENTGLPEFDDFGKKTKHQLCNGSGKIKKSELEKKR